MDSVRGQNQMNNPGKEEFAVAAITELRKRIQQSFNTGIPECRWRRVTILKGKPNSASVRVERWATGS
ncbi:MAG TPA: hypothetical protein VGQ39_09890 [Pyrinomonadaceae bacterium]|jgi:hypothetical protein|nr:hypothetical protein [Pyrinomonadaceae bacterium]